MKHVCKNCAFAKWEMTKDGRVNSKWAGKCGFVIQWPPIPISLSRSGSFSKLPQPTSGITYADETECPTWKWKEPLTKPKPEINWPEAVGEQKEVK